MLFRAGGKVVNNEDYDIVCVLVYPDGRLGQGLASSLRQADPLMGDIIKDKCKVAPDNKLVILTSFVGKLGTRRTIAALRAYAVTRSSAYKQLNGALDELAQLLKTIDKQKSVAFSINGQPHMPREWLIDSLSLFARKIEQDVYLVDPKM